jgi:hypothetical protein
LFLNIVQIVQFLFSYKDYIDRGITGHYHRVKGDIFTVIVGGGF